MGVTVFMEYFLQIDKKKKTTTAEPIAELTTK